ncbi:amidohydrolase family protein [Patulibacter sp. NPDC049589]|uniref:amidohydrolase family protein n=1 Tax=Patulibacter sp. NPDC049589 TaxID=3154731 RepID=UPI0034309525
MSTVIPSLDRETVLGGWSGAVIDADLHAHLGSVESLKDHLEPVWREFVNETGFQAPPWMDSVYPPGAGTTIDPGLAVAGGPVGSTAAAVVAGAVEPIGAEASILNCYWGLERVRHPDFAAGLARGINDWLIAEWLDKDPRLRASLVVPAFVPDEAAAEIDRVGGHPGFVQVLLPVRSSRLYGQRPLRSMFEAMVRNDLVAGVHYGGTADAPGPNGMETWFLEDYVSSHLGAFQAQLCSMVSEGLFQALPDLRVSFLESGFTWVGPTLWRMDREWPGLRRDVPWLVEAPSALVRRHVKFSGQPIDAGNDDQLRAALDWLGSDDLLMFASDFPHGRSEEATALLRVLSPEAAEKFMAGNARAHYRL